jgi:Family of unknown function (DUF6328)
MHDQQEAPGSGALIGRLFERTLGPARVLHEVETDESELERCQRNFNELLQELRVAQAGVQILFAFLLTLAFTGRLAESGTFVRANYMVALLSAGASAALLIAPVAQHRILFRLGSKPYLVQSSHRMASAGLGLLLVSMVSSVLLASHAVLALPLAIVATAVVALWFVALWVTVPWAERRSALAERAPRPPGAGCPLGTSRPALQPRAPGLNDARDIPTAI